MNATLDERSIIHPITPTDYGHKENPRLIHQQKRRDHKRHTCLNAYKTRAYTGKVNLNKTPLVDGTFETTFYNEDFNFFVTTVQMAGSQNWRTAMRDLYSKTTQLRRKRKRMNIDRDIVFSMIQRDDSIWNYYFKAIFVRHPFSRLLSVFTNVIANKQRSIFRQKSKEIISRYRKRAKETDIKYGTPSFPEFARYVAGKYRHRRVNDMNAFWQPVTVRLKPCLIPYDFIGKMETVDADTDHLFDILQISDLISLPSAGNNVSATSKEYLDFFRSHYDTIPTDVFNNLLKLYEADFKVFGYPIPSNQSDFSEESFAGI